MTDRTRIDELLDSRVLCLDGATGTYLQNQHLTAKDFGGEEFEGCNEILVQTRPDVILGMHRTYLGCGADIVETNTFGSTDIVLAEYPPLQEQAYELTLAATRLARQAADEYTAKTPDKPRFVAGSMGPTTKAISVTGGVTFEQLVHSFREQARAMVEGGADYLLLETCQDTRNIKAGLIGIRELSEELGRRLPVAVSGTIEPMGTMLAGQTAEALAISVAHHDLLYIGLNCATGPSFMADHVRALSELAQTRVACVPNAGLPDEDGNYLESPEMIAGVLRRFADHGWINVVGGCCGTTPAHIEALANLASTITPRTVPTHHRALYSGIDWVEADKDNRPLLVGERTNVIGSRRFKRLIVEEKFEEASEIGRAQVKKGAQIVDVCLANPDRDEAADMEEFLGQVINKVKAPLMIDSTQKDVIERALTYCQGKALINSINLEDGEERFAEIVPMARRFGAAFVVGCIDEDPEHGMAVTRERKLEVAKRSYELLTGEYGVPPEDIIFDPLVFPCATGDANYLGSAKETVEGVRLIKEQLPHCKTILGISNVSFGLPPTGREVLNSVFLYECTKAGLDMAIVNTQKLERYASIPAEERALAEDVLFATSDATVAAFVEHFRGASSRVGKEKSLLSLDERLASYIVEGTKEGLVPDLDTKLAEGTAPLDIINGPLMDGMDEVGRLFNDNQLIVAEVLQSAEAMKAAVAHLEPLMETGTSASKGKVVLATVKGDVHDIGKNLVEIILGNNGYEIINLGIKVPPVELVKAVKEHQPDILGLSGLLVKSAHMMVLSAEEMTEQGCTPDLLVGGAALTRNFTRKRIAAAYGGRVLYAKDAMDGLAWANRLVDADEQAGIDAFIAQETLRIAERDATPKAERSGPKQRGADVPVLESVPTPPDHERHVIREVSLDEVWPWINPKMLMGKHLGFRGDYAAALAAGDDKARRIHDVLDAVRTEARDGRLVGRCAWQWFAAQGDGDRLRLWAPDQDEPVVDWTLPRQAGGGVALPDYVRGSNQGRDHVALFACTFGEGVREWAEAEKAAGNYLKSYAISAVGLEAAEGLAEWIHARIRAHWGFADDPTLTMKDRFKAKYRGKRYSPGYPACPELEMQEGLFAALQPQDLGITLTDGHMMEPEASVTALVLHHPDARYFGV